MKPLVTIVAISFNQERFVIETLDSIKAQSFKNIQLIICDDGSTDRTKELINSWIVTKHPYTLFLNHPNNLGITKNLNSALPYIEGEFYQFIGCEDVMLPNKIESQVKLLKENSQYDIVYSDMLRMDEFGNIKELTYYQNNTIVPPRSGNLYELLIDKCFIATPSALMRIDVLKTLGGENEKLEVNDYDFWLRASKKFKFLYQEEVTMKYRNMKSSISSRRGAFLYRNGFLTFYYNYDKRMPYREKYNKRLLFGIKNLTSLKYKKTSLFSLMALLKTGKIQFLRYLIKGIPFVFNN